MKGLPLCISSHHTALTECLANETPRRKGLLDSRFEGNRGEGVVGRTARHLVTGIYIREAGTVVLTSPGPFYSVLHPSLCDGATTPSLLS